METAITSALQEQLSQDRQKLYEKIHLAGEFGTAKSDIIQAVSIQWRSGAASENAADIRAFTIDHTLYWTTPITSNGYTKFHDSYDCSTGSPRLTDTRVVDTNGITIESATNALIDYASKEATKALSEALHPTATPSLEH